MIKPGDRVKTTKGKFCGVYIAEDNIGTVIVVKKMSKAHMEMGCHPEVGVQFDKKISDGHCCNGYTTGCHNAAEYKQGHCRWGTANELIVIGEGEEIRPQRWVFNGKIVTGLTPIQEVE